MVVDALDRTVSTVSERATAFLLSATVPERDGFLQAVHPVAKLVGLVALVVVTVVTDDGRALAALLGLAVALALASRVPVGTFAERLTLPTLPSLLVVAPQAVLMDGPAMATLQLPVASLTVTEPGVAYVVAFAVRVAACVGFLSLLLLTTRFAGVLAAFRRLRAPPLAITLIAVTHRYLLLFFRELTRMTLARRSRRFAPESLRSSWRTSGSFLGTFFLRTFERGERVQRAAAARGGTQMRPYARRQPVGVADAGFAAVVALAVVGRVMLA
ncbi:cobalt ECF transporter T component CbiQ [Halobacteria archaeon HArc-gm2]|nr:cobalt ECF transporter T component CbiQ [Halobacteria archaeon HArc-gm2]